jgi:hypothetical protein
MPFVAGPHDACQRVVLGSVTGSNDVVGPSVKVLEVLLLQLDGVVGMVL